MTDAAAASWTHERILETADRWVWVPEEAREERTADYHLVAYPESFNVPTQVGWCRSERPAGELVDEVLGVVRAWGRPDVSFWVTELTRPSDLAEQLTSRGAEHIETVEIFTWDLGGALPTSRFEGGVRLVDDLESLRASYLVDQEVWGQQLPDDAALERMLAGLTEPDAAELRVVATLDEEPVCSGGASLAEEGALLRLWGAATRPAWRGRGAYGAVLAERMRIGRERGASIALVKGVTTTSAPILQRVGFTSHGFEHRLRLPV